MGQEVVVKRVAMHILSVIRLWKVKSKVAFFLLAAYCENDGKEEIGGERVPRVDRSKGWRKKVPKGLAILSEEDRKKISAKGLATRRKNAARRKKDGKE